MGGDEQPSVRPGKASEERDRQIGRTAIEVRRRLVDDEKRGIRVQRPGDRRSLLLATRELSRKVARPGSESKAIEQGQSAIAVVADAAGDRAKGYVLHRGKRLDQRRILMHVADEPTPSSRELIRRQMVDPISIPTHDPARRTDETSGNVQQRGFA